MPTIRVTIRLPNLLVLPPGEFPTPLEGGAVWVAAAPVETPGGALEMRTEVSALFDSADDADAVGQQRQQLQEADRLLRRTNHLLRWYRAITSQATVVELTRARASPFRFTIEPTGASWIEGIFAYEGPAVELPAGDNPAAFGDALRRGLTGKTDPDVATLNLLDAEYAMSVGRFREAVLLCWGAIDSTFVRKFRNLVDVQLGDEWSDAKDFLKGIDFGLRHKMTTGLRLLTGRSLYAEPNDFWQDLSASYSLRNRIIHDGQIAHEDDAKLAIRLARKIVEIAGSLP